MGTKVRPQRREAAGFGLTDKSKESVHSVDRQEQIDFILEHYESPYRHGPIPDATIVQKGGNPGCGDVLTMYLKVDGSGHLADISFDGEGCTISQAAASMITEMFQGKTLEDVEQTPSEVIVDLLGREIASTRLKCATLAINTTKAAVQELRKRDQGLGIRD